ncbi:MAG TPA: tripartite tricarboxylate transporter substrate binding protein [Xanthobacteraceae bacterium]|nr:tripartite tricarboxylate transporter substrate binding protein [Xanthobacteraceae bacterium]
MNFGHCANSRAKQKGSGKSGLLAAAFLLAGLSTGWAQADWPSHPITLIVPFAAGGGVDSSARIQAQVLGEILGQTIVVENVGAAAGTIGSARVANAMPDGYTFLIGNSGTHVFSQSLYRKLPYNSLEDFEPIGIVTESPRLLVARKDLPVKNLQELIAYMKANQEKMQYGSAGVGSGTHLPCALLNYTVGVNITMVPYRGEGPSLQDVIAGRLDYMCTTIQSGAAQAKQGTVKGIAVMAPTRAAIIPEVPTTGEQGLKGVEASVWNAFFFPKGTPKPIVEKMHKAVETMITRPDIRAKMETLGLEIVPAERRTPEYLTKFMKEDIARWGKVIKAAGIHVD